MLLPFHAHFDFPAPAGKLLELLPGIEDDPECHFDLVVHDDDDDDNLNVELRWNLPGTALDSGPEGKKVELPTGLIKDSAEEAVSTLLQMAGVPKPLSALVQDGLGDILAMALKALVKLKG